MLKNCIPVAAASILLAVVGCSTTPGDAAYRLGHRPQAADLYRTGAEQGDATAALKLGLMIHRGEVAAATYGTASSWFAKGCDLGDAVCCHNAGVAYEYGAEEGYPEVTKDLVKAQDYYLRAARRGYMQSQYNLGSMYSNQYLKDDVEGLKWLLLSQTAARKCQTDELCKWILEDPPGHLARLRNRMTTESQQEAEARAAKWEAKK